MFLIQVLLPLWSHFLFFSLQCHDESILPSFGKTLVSCNPLPMSSRFCVAHVETFFFVIVTIVARIVVVSIVVGCHNLV